MTDDEAHDYYSRLTEEPTRIAYLEQARVTALAINARFGELWIGEKVTFIGDEDGYGRLWTIFAFRVGNGDWPHGGAHVVLRLDDDKETEGPELYAIITDPDDIVRL